MIDPEKAVQGVKLSDNDLKLAFPHSAAVVGPSMCGKTEFLFKIIKYRNDLYPVTFHRIIYCEPQTSRPSNFFPRIQKEFPTAEYCAGIPDVKILNLERNSLPVLLILDDLMSELLDSPKMVKLVTMESHHAALGIWFSMQNFYHPSKFGKTIIKNCQYKVFFYSRTDQRELTLLSSQIANNSKFFASNFDFLLKTYPNEFHYLFIDGHSASKLPHSLFCRTHIFPIDKEFKLIFFLKKE